MRGRLRELDLGDLATMRWLIRVGALPQTEAQPLHQTCSHTIEGLIECWQAALPTLSGPRIKRAHQLIAGLKVLDPRCCRLVRWQPLEDSSTGERLLFAPRGLPDDCLLALPSSRLVRKLDFEQAWLNTLRVVFEDAASRGCALVTVSGTASDRFVKRAGRVIGLPVVAVTVSESSADRAAWFASALTNFAVTAQTANEYPVFVIDDDSTIVSPTAAPLRNQLLMQLADEVTGLAVRADGHCFRLLLDRIRTTSLPTRVIDDERLTRLAVLRELHDGGVELKAHEAGPQQDETSDSSTSHHLAQVDSAKTLEHEKLETESFERTQPDHSPTHDANDWAYLTHWTRGLESLALRDMPDELLDDWLRQPRAVDRTALASLQRILQSGRIIARRQSAHDSVPVVCFSAVPLKQLLAQRTYRPHRTRWDAEPFGLCIRRDALKKLGARPAIYGDDAVRESLAIEDRLWFQPLTSTTRTSTIDWSVEQEWRLPGDLQLEWLGPDDAFIFVRASEDAEQLKNVGDWPIVVVGQEVDVA